MPPPFVALLPLVLLAVGCGRGADEPQAPSRTAPSQPAAASAPFFTDVAAAVGIDFEHVNGMSGELYILEVMGPGAALFDYDGDGDLDLYLTQGHALPPLPADAPPPTDRLYENRLEEGALRFADVTERAGIEARGYGMGVAVGDVDGDGDLDLYVTNFGPNQLLLNRGDGTFEDATARSGADDPRWSTAATFFDYDRDGDLDLFVGNFLDFTVDTHRRCTAENSAPDYCSPTVYEPVPDRLLRGRGDGTFEDVTTAAGLDAAWGNALGALAADLDGDGWIDLYVANDSMPNQMWINRGDGTFEDRALAGGSALSREGRAEASMGVSAEDFDDDGDLDLFMTHLNSETNTLYRNAGGGLFEDRGLEQGLASPSLPYTSFGTHFFDLENDGDLDLLVVNGEVKRIWEQHEAGSPLPLEQPSQLFVNRGDGRFEEASEAAGAALTAPAVGRAAAFGDVDDDGDLDVVMTVNGGAPRLLLNRAAAGCHWIGIELEADGPVLGARLRVELGEDRVLYRRVRTDGSYLAASDPRVLVGLGAELPEDLRVVVAWPDGELEAWSDLPVDAYSTLRRGDGSLVSR